MKHSHANQDDGMGATSASDVISIDLLELPFTIELLSDEYQGKAIPLR